MADEAHRSTEGPKAVTAREALGSATESPVYADEHIDEHRRAHR
jgi:hypothetical protein